MGKAKGLDYKKGFKVKPKETNRLGEVTFTDGTYDFLPNQLQCEAYGYKYDKTLGVCYAFKYINKVNTLLNNKSNNVRGGEALVGTENSLLNGEDNITKGNNRNAFITGQENEVEKGVSNANVFGTLGEATADNSIVLGGNSSDDLLGERQVTTLMNGVQTTDGSTVDSYLNAVTSSYYAIPENTACYFQADILALRVGGSSGSGAVGDFKSWVERGVVINKSGTLSISRSRTSPASSGTTTSWSPISTVSGTNYVLTVTGAVDMTLEWVASIRFTQIKTSIAL